MTQPRPHFDDVSLAALDAAAEAGGSPASWGQLVAADDLPLAFAVLAATVELLDTRVAVLERRADRGGFERLRTVTSRLAGRLEVV